MMYEDYTIKPYISPDRDPNEVVKPVPKRNMEPLADWLLAGDIILLWRINFGTFTNETWYPKYFEYTYGIDGPSHLTQLLENGYVYEESAFSSLDHLNSSQKKAILKELGVKGLSKMKAADLDEALANSLSEEELGQYFTVRGIELTRKGEEALANHQEIVNRHPKKKM